ncbi:type II toxin-antitoxin system RelE/ParE family toxin [Flammeovirga sp. SJP92]|uniref:type II toxin-antitoxin system RelE/ParE family toxin n=1 Tax=Flammeovirga sp. SJP92 TaxID=1775430 RepID=UPI000795663A|nr:type II toxin-antitoxin system RelE/ParE family toxin [Flammeovirga sp. SJP92]KXX72747.1 hypothetical protein AVL50_32115 [Flammeovirga sp. SJP92]
MITINESTSFNKWLLKVKLKNKEAFFTIQMYLDRVITGNLGNTKCLREGIHEIKIDFQKGYRVYFINDRKNVILLLGGGTKGTQSADISKAIKLRKAIIAERKKNS